MAKWLDKYEQGGLVLKKKTKDNFGKKANPNDVQASVGPDFVGLGYNTKGRNYSPAWGGQFQMGGALPGATGMMYARYNEGGSMPGDADYNAPRKAGSAPANGKYTKKTKASAQKGNYVTNIKKKTKGIERELTEKYIEPQVDKAFEKAKQKGIGYGLHNGPFDAVRHAASASKVASSLPVVGMPMANILGAAHELSAGRGDLKELGSDLYNNFIGSVIGSIPFVSDDKKLDLIIAAQKNGILSTISNKNTDVSDSDRVIKNLSEKKEPALKKRGLQNGGEMKYYQEGLDFKPKSISKNGSVIKDDRGQWAYPGEITEIGSNDITMQGVDYPVLGVSDTGDTQMMYPDQDYKFDGEKVTEFPMAQDGRNLSKELQKEAEERLSKMGKPKSTISQYTPKPGEQARFDKQKLERIAEESKPLNKFARSKASGNLQDAVLFALDIMGAAEGVGAIKSALKSKAKNVINSKVTRGPINYWEEPEFAKRNPNFNPDVYTNSPIGNPYASRNIPEGLAPYEQYDSQIDWEKWNKEIPQNKPLLEEYHNIEETTKNNGTWMKNPNGSPFAGTPEQFIQQNSSNFKKAFGNSKLVNPDGSPTIQYHGSAKSFDTFDESKFQLGDAGYSGVGIYTTPSKTTASSYTRSSRKLHTGDIEPTVYELYGQANNPISSSQLINESKGRDLFNFHRDANFKGNLSSYESLRDFDAAIRDQLLGVENIRPWNDAREIVFPTNKQLKSAVGNNGMFDMNNPNIYKALLPAVGIGAVATSANKKEKGGWLNKWK